MKSISALGMRVGLIGLSLTFLGALTAFGQFTPPASVPYNAAAYADRAKLRNSTGVSSLGAYAGPSAAPGSANLFSQNVSYSIPLLSLPGRAGLNLSLTLAYNSKVWIKSGTTIYFDGDKGWPAVGWRLGFGRIDGVYSGPDGFNHYYLQQAEVVVLVLDRARLAPAAFYLARRNGPDFP